MRMYPERSDFPGDFLSMWPTSFQLSRDFLFARRGNNCSCSERWHCSDSVSRPHRMPCRISGNLLKHYKLLRADCLFRPATPRLMMTTALPAPVIVSLLGNGVCADEPLR